MLTWYAGMLTWYAGMLTWYARMLAWYAGMLAWYAGIMIWYAGMLAWYARMLAWYAGMARCRIRQCLGALPPPRIRRPPAAAPFTDNTPDRTPLTPPPSSSREGE